MFSAAVSSGSRIVVRRSLKQTLFKLQFNTMPKQSELVTLVPVVSLNNGDKIPIIGLGTWKSLPGETGQAVLDAIDAGYRHIDGAHLYNNEAEVGKAINDKISEGVIKRSDVFLTSKLWNTDHHPDNVRTALLKTLEHLETPYLDLYLIHFPIALKHGDGLLPVDGAGNMIFEDVDFVDTWRELERAVDDGLVRAIGISNFNKEQTERILSICRIRPVVNQIELHPYLTQHKLVDYLRSKDIAVVGYSPLGSPDSPFFKSGDPSLLEHPVVSAIAEKHKKSVAQILIRYQIERGIVVIPKSVTKSRIVSNFDVFDFKLSAEDLETIHGIDIKHRFLAVEVFSGSKYYPFNADY